MLREPLPPAQAEKVARNILRSGQTAFSKHAIEELAKDQMVTVDAENVVRGGRCVSFDLERGTWRYRFSTAKMTVVVVFRSETEMVVVTAWRTNK